MKKLKDSNDNYFREGYYLVSTEAPNGEGVKCISIDEQTAFLQWKNGDVFRIVQQNLKASKWILKGYIFNENTHLQTI